jgi:hypothetical protein
MIKPPRHEEPVGAELFYNTSFGCEFRNFLGSVGLHEAQMIPIWGLIESKMAHERKKKLFPPSTRTL